MSAARELLGDALLLCNQLPNMGIPAPAVHRTTAQLAKAIQCSSAAFTFNVDTSEAAAMARLLINKGVAFQCQSEGEVWLFSVEDTTAIRNWVADLLEVPA